MSNQNRILARSNPALRSAVQGSGASYRTGVPLKVHDVIHSFGVFMGITVIVGIISSYVLYPSPSIGSMLALALGLIQVAFVFFLSRKPERMSSVSLATTYAVIEGIFLGAATNLYAFFPESGIEDGSALIGKAIIGTVIAFALTVFAYSRGIIKVTDGYLKTVSIMTLSALVVYLVSIFAGVFFGLHWLNDGGVLSLVFSVFCIVTAVMSIVADLFNVDMAIRNGADRSESVGLALGMIITLTWLYLEILRLLRNIAVNNR